jgi:hypothetical protein
MRRVSTSDPRSVHRFFDVLRDAVLRDAVFRERLRGGTFAPFLRASDNPIAIACLRLFTVRPEPPLLRVPRFRRRIADSTVFEALLPYFAMTSVSSEHIVSHDVCS